MKKNNKKTTNKTKNRAKKKKCATKEHSNSDVRKNSLYRHNRGHGKGSWINGRKAGAYYFDDKLRALEHHKASMFVTGSKDKQLAEELVSVEDKIFKIFREMYIPTLSFSEVKLLNEKAGFSPIKYDSSGNDMLDKIENVAKNLQKRKWVRADRDIASLYASAIYNFFMCSVATLGGYLPVDEVEALFDGRYFNEEALHNRIVFLRGLVELYHSKGNDAFVSFLFMMSSMGNIQETNKQMMSGTARSRDTLEKLFRRTNLNDTELFAAKLLNEELGKELPYGKHFDFLVQNARSYLRTSDTKDTKYMMVKENQSINPFYQVAKRGIRFDTAKILVRSLVLKDMLVNKDYGTTGKYDESTSTLTEVSDYKVEDDKDGFVEYMNFLDELSPESVSNDNQELRMVAE